jgi:hypothetical protein
MAASSGHHLHRDQFLELSVIHGDGTTTAAKKGRDNLGYSGHKHLKGDKAVAFCDRACNIIAPFVTAPGNRNESPLLRNALPRLTAMARAIGADLQGSTVSLDGVYDCRENRQAIFYRGMRPNIAGNPCGRKAPKRGRRRHFDAAIFAERFSTIERVFAWEDTFRRLLLRFERISEVRYALKTAYMTINRGTTAAADAAIRAVGRHVAGAPRRGHARRCPSRSPRKQTTASLRQPLHFMKYLHCSSNIPVHLKPAISFKPRCGEFITNPGQPSFKSAPIRVTRGAAGSCALMWSCPHA